MEWRRFLFFVFFSGQQQRTDKTFFQLLSLPLSVLCFSLSLLARATTQRSQGLGVGVCVGVGCWCGVLRDVCVCVCLWWALADQIVRLIRSHLILAVGMISLYYYLVCYKNYSNSTSRNASTRVAKFPLDAPDPPNKICFQENNLFFLKFYL